MEWANARNLLTGNLSLIVTTMYRKLLDTVRATFFSLRTDSMSFIHDSSFVNLKEILLLDLNKFVEGRSEASYIPTQIRNVR